MASSLKKSRLRVRVDKNFKMIILYCRIKFYIIEEKDSLYKEGYFHLPLLLKFLAKVWGKNCN